MKYSDSVMEASLAYAVRIVSSKFATVEEAARTCGVHPADLQARLDRPESQPPSQQKKLFESFNR